MTLSGKLKAVKQGIKRNASAERRGTNPKAVGRVTPCAPLYAANTRRALGDAPYLPWQKLCVWSVLFFLCISQGHAQLAEQMSFLPLHSTIVLLSGLAGDLESEN